MPFFVTQDGSKLHYEVDGRGETTVVMMHGWCSNLRHWERQLPALVDRHRVIRIDRVGHGESSPQIRERSPSEHAADAAALLHSLGIEACVVVAHAGGGPTAFCFAGQYPNLVRAAVFVDAGLHRGASNDKARNAKLVVQLAAPDYQQAFRRQYESYFHPLSGRALAEQAAADAARTPQRVIVDELISIFCSDTIELAQHVKQPVLFVVSSNARSTWSSVREHLPQAQFAQVVAAGHFLHLEVPDQFNPMLLRFLAALEPEKGSTRQVM